MSNAHTRILVVDDEEIVRESLGGWLEKDGYTVASAADGPSALERIRADRWSILIVDLKMPGMDGLQVLAEAKKLQPELAVVIMTAYATVDTAVAAMKAGAYDYLVKPFDPEELSLMMQKIVSQQELVRENTVLRQALKKEYRFRDLLSKSPTMQSVFELARTAARSNSTILVLGESGSGKEVLARAIHAESPRAESAFVAAMIRTSTSIGSFPPTRWNLRSSSTRSRSSWSFGPMSPTSSRNSVPPWAASNLPFRRAMAPVKAPFS